MCVSPCVFVCVSVHMGVCVDEELTEVGVAVFCWMVYLPSMIRQLAKEIRD